MAARIFVLLVASVAVAIFSFGFSPIPITTAFVGYIAVGVATSGMKVILPGVAGNLSVTYALTLLCLLELSSMEALAVALISTVVQIFWKPRDRPKPVHVIFNLSCITVSVSATAFIFHQPLLSGFAAGEPLRLMLAAITYFATNTLIVSTVIGLSEKRNVLSVWSSSFTWSGAYYVLGALIVEMIHASAERFGWGFTIILAPLSYLIYRSYNIYLEKLQQEKKHAEEMTALHMRTIEALALAIEAKDECTHEHLRRVQVYSMKIAEQLDLPPHEFQAIQAAAILHDIGKLAVPDYIISKPGKLTPEEFDKMKVHTTVGAAILEQVGFPYAVAPIVRSHHERWDGTGYPDGLRGEEIPIGARIISAVDCLDAMASDRQYRRALPLDEAMEYVASLAGKNFDARVIEILKRNYKTFEAITIATPLSAMDPSIHAAVTRGGAPEAGFAQSSTSHQAMDRTASTATAWQQFYNLSQLVNNARTTLNAPDLLVLVSSYLKKIIPFDCMAVYVCENDILQPIFVDGEGSEVFRSLTIRSNQGLSGWVVENKRAILNGNPAVESNGRAGGANIVKLKSALSVPFAGKSIRGAVTLYRAQAEAFNEDHLRILASLSDRIASAIQDAPRPPRNIEAGQSLLLHVEKELATAALPFGLVVCSLDYQAEIKAVSRQLGYMLESYLTPSESGAQISETDFILRLETPSRQDLELRIERIQAGIGNDSGIVNIGSACFPDDGRTLSELLSHADEEIRTRQHHAPAFDRTGPGLADILRVKDLLCRIADPSSTPCRPHPFLAPH